MSLAGSFMALEIIDVASSVVIALVGNGLFSQFLLQRDRAALERDVARLKNEASIRDKVAAVRGRGLFLGIELKNPPEKLVDKGLERGVIVNLTSQKVMRVAPPINIDRRQWDEGLDAIITLIRAL